jgi:hypothetical protein
MLEKYDIKLDSSQISLLRFILEVTLNRQLNYLAHNQKLINNLETKIIKAENDIKMGKSGFFYNPKSKLKELKQKLNILLDKRTEPKLDLRTTRELYDKILDSQELIFPGDKKIFRKNKFFEDRKEILIYGSFKEYFKIEHLIY